MAFDIASLFIGLDGAGQYVVAPAIVRWRGQQGFNMIEHANPTSSDPDQPDGQPFAIANVRKDPDNATFRIADLTFVQDIGVWHSCFDGCDIFFQPMHVDGNGVTQTLTIKLSCSVHPKHVLAQISEAFREAAVATATAIATVFLLVTRRIFTSLSRNGRYTTGT